ncbi:MAG TPA: glycosyltransferase family 1 protein [Burkholderiaceae bacterium]|nr:glycosyltransferase family 1 protein [Burkholderiaceae bacterium]
MVRVVINGRFLVQVQTGVQRYAGETLQALDRLLSLRRDLAQQLRCELAVPRGARVPRLQNITVRTLPFLRGHAWEQVSLAWFARDAFLVNFSYSGPVFKRRQMITVHDAAVAALPGTFSRAYRALHYLMLLSLKAKAEVVMTVSEFSRREIGYHFGMERDVVIGHCGWEHARAGDDSLATPRSLGLEPDAYVLAVGSIKPNKNFALLGRALGLLVDFPLPVAIAGARDASVFQAAQQPPGDVRMLGYVSDRALADLYKHAACFVLPSLYEGFGLPALEAMANGCPVLAARAGSIPEVCGDAALYFDPYNPASLARALRRIVADTDLRDELRANARARLDRYTWRGNAEIVAAQLLRQTPHAQPAFSGTVGVQRRT